MIISFASEEVVPLSPAYPSQKLWGKSFCGLKLGQFRGGNALRPIHCFISQHIALCWFPGPLVIYEKDKQDNDAEFVCPHRDSSQARNTGNEGMGWGQD